MISFSQKFIVAVRFQIRESKLRLSDLPEVTQLRPQVIAKVKVVIYHIIISTLLTPLLWGIFEADRRLRSQIKIWHPGPLPGSNLLFLKPNSKGKVWLCLSY